MIEVHASEVHSSRTCHRKWHGVYVQGAREPDSEATARGTAIHAILEDYLNGKGPIDTTTDYGQIAASGLKYLPEPGSVHTELDFSFAAESWIYAGTIDMVRLHYVGDHKTTSNFKYQKDEATLINDPQVILYGTIAQQDGKSDVECQWIYYRTSGARKAQQTRFIYPGSLLKENKQRLDEEVKAMLKRRALPMLELEPTPSACFKYGKPCHMRHKCVDIKPTIGSLMSTTKNALLADLRAKAGGLTTAPAGVPMPPPPTVAAPPSPTVPSIAPPTGNTPSLPALTPPPPGGLPVLAPPPGPAAGSPQTATAAAPGGLPALPSLTPPGPAKQPELPGIDPAVLAAAAAEHNAKAAPAAPTLPVLTPPPSVSGPVATSPIPAVAQASAPASAPAPTADNAAIDTLYVDCLPIGETVIPFSAIAAECHQGIKDVVGLAHYKLAQFGTGPAIWSEAVKTQIGSIGSVIPALYVDTSASDGKDALEVLFNLSARVVRGIK